MDNSWINSCSCRDPRERLVLEASFWRAFVVGAWIRYLQHTVTVGDGRANEHNPAPTKCWGATSRASFYNKNNNNNNIDKPSTRPPNMSGTVEIKSPAQLSSLLSSSRIVVVNCTVAPIMQKDQVALADVCCVQSTTRKTRRAKRLRPYMTS